MPKSKLKEPLGAKIVYIAPDSLAEEIGLAIGDEIVAVNDKKVTDLIDLSFAMADEEIELLVRHADGESEIIAFDKEIDEELGAEFASAVFDHIRPCANHCKFCFVDQMPPNCRQSLYIKDDDYRLSFLSGSFITLTNLRDADFERIAKLHLSPLHISVHTLDMARRCELMGTPLAGKLTEQLDRLGRCGISYHAQIVLCPGQNDGDELFYTINELYKRRPAALSLAIVPVGLTKYRDGLTDLQPFNAAGAIKIIEEVSALQKKFRQECGENFVYLGDEFYLLAGKEFPSAEEYDGFPQYDNGVGLVRSFIDEFAEAKKSNPNIKQRNDKITVLSGTSFAPLLKKLAATTNNDKINSALRSPLSELDIVAVTNEFFGHPVSVSGLLAGGDIRRTLKQLAAQDALGEKIIIPATCLKDGEDIFLDDVYLEDIEKEFDRKIYPVSTGREFFEKVYRSIE